MTWSILKEHFCPWCSSVIEIYGLRTTVCAGNEIRCTNRECNWSGILEKEQAAQAAGEE
jgi:hypothetical protein